MPETEAAPHSPPMIQPDMFGQDGYKKVYIPAFRLPVSTCTREELFYFMDCARLSRQKVLIDNVNLDILWHAQRDPEYLNSLATRSAVNVVDGVPIMWLAKMAGVHVPERLVLTDVVTDLMTHAVKKNYSVFIVGSNPDTLAQAKAVLRDRQELPVVVESWAEPREKLFDPDTNRAVLDMIRDASPDILFAAMGSPFQTKWLSANWDALPDCIMIPVGGAFDYLAGQVGRAPGWMQRSGLEWLYRLLFDHQKRDRSLFERYILTDLPFAMAMAVRILKKSQEAPAKGLLRLRP